MDRQRCVECGEWFDPIGLRIPTNRIRVTCSLECSWLWNTKRGGEWLSLRWSPGHGFESLVPEVDPVEVANLEHRARSDRIVEVF